MDRQLDELARAATDSHDTDSHIENAPRGAQIVQNNQLSTPVAIAAIACFFLAGILGGVSIGMAYNANDKAGQARMEARLAQEDLIMLRAAVKAHGIAAESAHDHD
jgi:hypothetical protein